MPFIIYPQLPENKLAVIIPCLGITKTIETEIQVPVIGEDGEPTGETTTQTTCETVELTIEEIAAKDVPAETPYAIVDSLENVDNEYFDGFVYEDGSAVVDIAACKSIHLNKFRAARKPLLAKLDVDFMKAVETFNAGEQSLIAVKKQELRDVTQTPLPDTLEEIKAVWPDILN